MGSTLLIDQGGPGADSNDDGPGYGAQPPDGDTPGGGPGDGHNAGQGHGRRRAAALVALVALVGGGLGAGLSLGRPSPAPSAQTSAKTTTTLVLPSPKQALAAPVQTTSSITAANAPATVKVIATDASPTSQGQLGATGTGIVVTSSGEVLTNNHVIEGSTSVRVTVPGHGTYPAAVLGVDPSADVALLQVERYKGRLPTVQLGNASTVAVGDRVVAIGYAYGLSPVRVVTGTVTGLGMTQTASDQGVTPSTETLHGLVQVSAPIVSGDSGGPLLNTRGQVVGIDAMGGSQGAGEGSTGYAITINRAVGVANRIAKGQGGNGVTLGQSAFLGVFETAATPSTGGVYVSDVAIDGPAEQAGLAGGDTITAVDGQATPTSAALAALIASRKPGDSVRVTYLDSSGTSHVVTLRLGAITK